MSGFAGFVGPMVPHYPRSPGGFMTGCLPEGCYHTSVLRDVSFDVDSLDAPDYLAMGGVLLSVCGRFSMPSQIVVRPGTWS